MKNPKDILVITTLGTDGIKIKKYLRPVSAHVVVGTDIFTDIIGSITDVFGGRSKAYQKQLTSLNEQAIEEIKIAAYKLGANCVVGLQINVNEISGKGKQMFMISAIGTAVIIDSIIVQKVEVTLSESKPENVSVERINLLLNKRKLVQKANKEELVLSEPVWNFITANQVSEVFHFLLRQFESAIPKEEMDPTAFSTFKRKFIAYIDSLAEQKKSELLYNAILDAQSEKLQLNLVKIIEELNLFDFQLTMQVLKNDDFQKSKIGLQIVKCNKPYYSREDIVELQTIQKYVREKFVKRGVQSTKKQLLSSKEKEVWTCECGKINDIEVICSGCRNNIYGFKQHEVQPLFLDNFIEEKIDLIKESLAIDEQ
jgi:uncharacterized protein YbjQ (UPF0145 family)